MGGKEALDNKVSRIMEFLDKPGKEDKTALVADMRPQVIAAYVPNVDADGHKHGPNSTEIRDTIQSADKMLDNVFKGLEDRNLTDIVNVIVVSDHGMATTDTSRLIQLEDLIDTSKIEHIDGWPLYGLRPYEDADLKPLYDQLKEAAESNPNYDVYLRDEDMPEKYHFSKNDRIAPLWIVPKTGWAIVTKDEFNVARGQAEGQVYHPRGLHGYDHQHPLMRAIFIARGPAFPHPANSEIEVFQNIEVYNMLCDSVGIQPKPNNGTLRLPLKPVGTHKPEDTPEVPEDPVPQTPTAAEATEQPRPTVPGEASPSPSPSDQEGDGGEGGHEEEEGEDKTDNKDGDTSNDQDKDTDGSEKEEDGIQGLWHWFTDKVGDVWDSITGS